MNSVQLIGTLTRDPDHKTLPTGSSACELRLAVNRRRKDASGERIEQTGYFTVVAYGPLADTSATYLARGRKVAVTGRLEFREWTAGDGATRSAVEVVAREIDFLSPPPTGDQVVEHVSEPEVVAVGASSGDDEIPF